MVVLLLSCLCIFIAWKWLCTKLKHAANNKNGINEVVIDGLYFLFPLIKSRHAYIIWLGNFKKTYISVM